MKSVIVISVLTFILIFGGVVVLSTQLNKSAAGAGKPDLAPDDYSAAERVFHDMEIERDRIQGQKESLKDLQGRVAVQEKVFSNVQKKLMETVDKMQATQKTFVDEKNKSATKLAKMYEAMKPDQAAPILGSLDPDIIMEIMGRMNDREAAKILARMDPALAAQLSTRMSLKGGA